MKQHRRFKDNSQPPRNDLTGEYVWGDIGQLTLLLIFLTVWISDAFVFHYSDALASSIPLLLRLPLGILVLAASGWMAKHSLQIVFGEIREPPVIIRKGMFGRVRHPIYLGAILLYAGLLLLKFSLAATGVWAVILVFYHLIARHEEQLLLKKFGPAYERYQREVPMWIPRLRPPK